MAERVYCPSCQSMQVAGDIHSCFDAALIVRVKDAERAVIDAAKVYADAVSEFVTGVGGVGSSDRMYDARLSLLQRTTALRTLEAPSE